MAERLQSPDMRHVRVGKDNTTITLEDEFWEQLRIIAITRNTAISQLLAEIDRTMRLQSPRPGRYRVRTLSAAVRVFVLQTLILRASSQRGAQQHTPPEEPVPAPRAADASSGRIDVSRVKRSAQFPWSLPEGMHSSRPQTAARGPDR
jgi:predicted DNA-binding ribbon-helix-helix protein